MTNLNKFSIIDKQSISANSKRFEILSVHLGFKQIHSTELTKYLANNVNCLLLINDSFSFKTLFNILFYSLKNKNIKIQFLCLELYSLSFKAILSDFKIYHSTSLNLKLNLYQYYLLQLRIFRYFLINTLINYKCDILYLPSEARKIYVSNLYNVNIKVIPNLPLRSFDKALEGNNDFDNTIFSSYKFIYLPGRINNLNDLNIVLDYAYSNNLKLVVSSSEKVFISSNDIRRNALIETGPIPHDRVLNFMRNCISGLILYDSKSLNQKFAASSKLFEFLYLGKMIIISDNYGVLQEIKKYSVENFMIVGNIQKLNTIDGVKLNFDTKYLYENYLNNSI